MLILYLQSSLLPMPPTQSTTPMLVHALMSTPDRETQSTLSSGGFQDQSYALVCHDKWECWYVLWMFAMVSHLFSIVDILI